MLTWNEVRQKNPIYLNLGGKGHCYPNPEYKEYISVDINGGEGWRVEHDLTQPIPLPDASVERIHTEDFFHYLNKQDLQTLIAECYRLLKPGSRLRIGVPDYMHPRLRCYAGQKSDPRYPLHLLLTTTKMMDAILERSPFEKAEFYHYWEGNTFIEKPIDYSLGMIQRTPENDPRNKHIRLKGHIKNFLHKAANSFKISELEERTFLEGSPFFVTEIVVDFIKQP